MEKATQKTAYYNTTNVAGPQLELFTARAGKQDLSIGEWFKRNPTKKYSREQIEMLFKEYPAQSVGRALNTLMNNGVILKLKEKRESRWGVMCHLYQLAP